jgi:hypothetical protein
MLGGMVAYTTRRPRCDRHVSAFRLRKLDMLLRHGTPEIR